MSDGRVSVETFAPDQGSARAAQLASLLFVADEEMSARHIDHQVKGMSESRRAIDWAESSRSPVRCGDRHQCREAPAAHLRRIRRPDGRLLVGRAPNESGAMNEMVEHRSLQWLK
jgi:hypothetical protein